MSWPLKPGEFPPLRLAPATTGKAPHPRVAEAELKAQRAEAKLHYQAYSGSLRSVRRAPLVRFHSNKRRVAKLNRTPPWANQEAIKAIYREAARLSSETGVEHHVDHIIPLQGELVSGLHVESNLQILPWHENVTKGNRFEVEI